MTYRRHQQDRRTTDQTKQSDYFHQQQTKGSLASKRRIETQQIAVFFTAILVFQIDPTRVRYSGYLPIFGIFAKGPWLAKGESKHNFFFTAILVFQIDPIRVRYSGYLPIFGIFAKGPWLAKGESKHNFFFTAILVFQIDPIRVRYSGKS